MDVRQRDVATAQEQADVQLPDSDPVRDLLLAYRETLRRADEMPAFLWLRTRPPGSSALAGWLRVPRPTVGVEMIVLFHVTRTVDALLRAYAARAALSELDQTGLRQREMLTTFRTSLRQVKWRWFVVGAVVVASVLSRLLLELVAKSLHALSFGLSVGGLSESQLAEQRKTMDGLASAISTFSGASLEEGMTRITQSGGTGLFILVASVLSAAYCVMRLPYTAFRLKRILFNLADEPAPALLRATSSWHVTRTVGLYARERAVLVEAGARGAEERPFDLAASLLGSVLICWGFLAYFLTSPTETGADRVGDVALAAGLLAGRVAWLGYTYLERRRPNDPWKTPAGALLPVTRRVVDVRSAVEAVAMGLGWFVTAPIAWHRLTRQLADLGMEAQARRNGWSRRGRALWPSLSAIALIVLTPLPLAVRCLRLARLTGNGLRDRRIVLLVASSALSLVGVAIFLVLPDRKGWANLAGLVLVLALAAGLGATQALQNGLVREYGQPRDFDLVSTGPSDVLAEFHPPPSWPQAPVDWTPPSGWRPDPNWGPVPPGWQLWTLP